MSFRRLLEPRSIAVFGGFQAQEVIRQCRKMGYDGELWPVHPKKTEIEGCRAHPSVAELPGSPDAAYVAVNRYLTVEIVRDLAGRGAGGAVCYATGFTEAGEEGEALEHQLLEACGDMPLIGPNCYGMLNYVDGAMLWPDQQGGRRVDKGIALITNSSNVAFNLTMQRRGLPIAYVLTLGNKLRFDLHHAVREFAHRDSVTAIGLYVEALTDPHAFEEAVDVARDLGKPIVAIKVGRSAAAQAMVLSHTASLAGADDLIDALFERKGVARVDSMEALMEALKVLHVLGPLGGGRLGAMSTSGGDLALMGDAMLGTSMTMPALSDAGTERLRATVHERIVAANPLDYQMFDWNDADRLAAMFTAFLDERFDVAVSMLDYPRADKCDPSSWNGAERGFIRAAKESGAPTAILSTFSDTFPESLAERLIDEGIVPLVGMKTGLAGLQAAIDIGAAWAGEPLPGLLHDATASAARPTHVLDEAEAKERLAASGVTVPDSRVVDGPEAAIAAAREIGFPVAVKALGVPHKTEVGGVRLGLETQVEIEQAVEEMTSLAERFLVERMVEGAVAELIVGVGRDRQFGPYLLLGGGGVLVELLDDARPLLLPTSRATVRRALEGLQCAPLLTGFRGEPAADVEAAVDAVMAIAHWIESEPSTIDELDINPLLLRSEGQGAIAADALLSLRRPASPTTDD